MTRLTGRRSTGRLKSFGSMMLDTLDEIATASADSTKRRRIEEIDTELEELKQVRKDLKQERDHLIKGLVEPGNLKVSKDYDRSWTKPTTETVQVRSFDTQPIMDQYFGAPGRLTKCKGQFSDTYVFDVHPGCPYINKKHNAHEFTLRD